MAIITVLFFLTLFVLAIFSYGFIDPNLVLSKNPIFVRFHTPLYHLAYQNRPVATMMFLIILLLLFFFYCMFLRYGVNFFSSKKNFIGTIIVAAAILVLAYPALSYDLFNYMTTAKVAFTYHENPYIVMPIEIPNEPNLAFTRAANKLALYGPVWLAITAIPHYLGLGNIWGTIIAFKFINALAYFGMVYLIYRITKSLKNVLYFAFNPLVLIETLMSGHNDIFMMVFALLGLVLWNRKDTRSKVLGCISFFFSWWIKFVTILLTPIFLFRKFTLEQMFRVTYWFFLVIFFVAAPLREELYPWYAVWLVSTAAFLPMKRHTFIFEFTFVLSFALELRALPYMWMGYYEGPGPLLRFLVTAIPIGIYFLFFVVRKLTRKSS